jgi:hypothetical protein
MDKMTEVVADRNKYMQIYTSLLKVQSDADLEESKKVIERRVDSPMYAIKMAAWEKEYNSRKKEV